MNDKNKGIRASRRLEMLDPEANDSKNDVELRFNDVPKSAPVLASFIDWFGVVAFLLKGGNPVAYKGALFHANKQDSIWSDSDVDFRYMAALDTMVDTIKEFNVRHVLVRHAGNIPGKNWRNRTSLPAEIERALIPTMMESVKHNVSDSVKWAVMPDRAKSNLPSLSIARRVEKRWPKAMSRCTENDRRHVIAALDTYTSAESQNWRFMTRKEIASKRFIIATGRHGLPGDVHEVLSRTMTELLDDPTIQDAIRNGEDLTL